MPDIFVSFEGALSAEDRAALRGLGWKLYENAIGSPAASTFEREEAPSTRWRHVVRVPEKDTEELHKLMTDAIGREPANPLIYYDVDGAADRLGVHRETIKRRVARGELVADRRGSGRTSGLLLHKRSIDHLAEVEAHQRRVHEAGSIVGYGDFADEVKAAKDLSANAKDVLLAVHDKHELFDRIEREMYSDPSTRQRFEQLDEEARFEAEARELADRVRRAERIRERARELLEEEDDTP